MASNSGLDGANERSQHIEIDPIEYEARIVRRLATRYRNTLRPEQVEKLDAALSTFFPVPANVPLKLSDILPPDHKNDGALYIQGDSGIGKSAIPAAAARRFCNIVGLNFVDGATGMQAPKPDDFIFQIIDMSGKTNLSDITGGFSRTEVGSKPAINDLAVSAKAVAEFCRVEVEIGEVVKKNGNSSATVTFRGEASVLKDCAEGFAEHMSKLGADLNSDITLEIGGVVGNEIQVAARESANTMMYASQMMPNQSLAVLSMANYGMLMVDDIGNCPMQLRNAFLQAALDGKMHNVVDISNIDIMMTANPPQSSYGLRNSNVISDRSIPEITRTTTMSLKSTPEAWVAHVMSDKELAKDNAHFASYISIHGRVPGIFNPSSEVQYEKGAPLPVPRAISSAMRSARVWSRLAKASDQSLDYFHKELLLDVSAKVGNHFADSYINHVRVMEAEALPMAENCIDNGQLDTTKFNKKANPGFSEGLDFAFRFAFALADYASTKMAADGADQDTILDNMMLGLSALPDHCMNASLAQFRSRLEANDNFASDATDTRTGRRLNLSFLVKVGDAMGRNKHLFDSIQTANRNMQIALTGVYMDADKAAQKAKKAGAKTAAPAP